MFIHDLKPNAKKQRKRLGRGNSSGKGNFSGRGCKGQLQHGGKLPHAFEGGQMPIMRRVPKLKGFKSPNKKFFQIVNVSSLDVFDDGDEVSLKTLFEKKLIKDKFLPVKILGNGKIKKKLKIDTKNINISKGAEIKLNNLAG